MKLLFDENLSPRLVRALESQFPGSGHVQSLGLLGAEDRAIWEYARQQDFTVVSKDNDFRQLSFVYGAPPKVVWLSIGNAGTERIIQLLKDHQSTIQVFASDNEASLLVLP